MEDCILYAAAFDANGGLFEPLLGAEDAVKLQAVNQLGIASAQGQILNYQGGPGSTYGIGSTIIRRATSTIPALPVPPPPVPSAPGLRAPWAIRCSS